MDDNYKLGGMKYSRRCSFCGSMFHPLDNVYPRGDMHTRCYNVMTAYAKPVPDEPHAPRPRETRRGLLRTLAGWFGKRDG